MAKSKNDNKLRLEACVKLASLAAEGVDVKELSREMIDQWCFGDSYNFAKACRNISKVYESAFHI